jgi:arylsulfatase
MLDRIHKVRGSFRIVLLFIVTVFAVLMVKSYIQELNFSQDPKNLIIISIDTLRQDHVGVYGYNKNLTPNIDKWAKKATVFTNAYTQTPVTTPSFVSLMTGLTPFESGIFSNPYEVRINHSEKYQGQGAGLPLTEDAETLAEVLRSNGYVTTAFLLNHTLNEDFTNFDQGFAEYNFQKTHQVRAPADKLTKDVTNWLEARTSDNSPFFLWVHYLDPHTPYQPRPESACRINSRFCGKGAEEDMQRLHDSITNLVGCHNDPLSPEKIDLHKDLYDAEISETDRYVGQVLAKIDESGLSKNSIVVIYGDHGESFENNYNFRHGLLLNESSVKIPLIIYTPDNKSAGRKAESFVRSADIFTTMLSLLGINAKAGGEENADLSYIFGASSGSEGSREDKPLFFVNTEATKFAMLKDEYKYIYSLENDECSLRGNRELYNLKSDPKEINNIVNEERDIAEKLHLLLTQYLRDHPLEIKYNQTVESYKREIQNTEKQQEIINELKSLGY